MAFTYAQDSGALYDPNGVLMMRGYSGNGAGLNNPAMDDRVGVGPIPVGDYTVGAPHAPIDHLGPLALPLYPAKTNNMKGRLLHARRQLQTEPHRVERLRHHAAAGPQDRERGFRQAADGGRDKT